MTVEGPKVCPSGWVEVGVDDEGRLVCVSIVTCDDPARPPEGPCNPHVSFEDPWSTYVTVDDLGRVEGPQLPATGPPSVGLLSSIAVALVAAGTGLRSLGRAR